jgi:dTDP-4-dehydrorhamnose reductase
VRQDTQLIVGADGVIGRELAAVLRSIGHEVVATSRRPDAPLRLDLGTADSWTPPACDVAYLCAGVTSLKTCEEHPGETRRVNVLGTERVVRALRDRGVFVIFLSTNLVFDGTAAHAPGDGARAPSTEYGRQKAEAETTLLSSGGCAVVRLTKVVPPGMPLFASWRNALSRRETIHPFGDKWMAPISLGHVVHALVEIGRRRLDGIWQLSADRDISYADAAFRIAARLGASPSLVVPTACRGRGSELDCGPRHTTLDDSRARRELDLVPDDVFRVVDAGAGV